MKILVFGKTKELGMHFLEILIGDFKFKEIKSTRINSCDYLVELKDGTIYQVVSASDGSRGHKCNQAYVDRNIDTEIVDNVIKPCLYVSKLPYDEQIIWF